MIEKFWFTHSLRCSVAVTENIHNEHEHDGHSCITFVEMNVMIYVFLFLSLDLKTTSFSLFLCFFGS